MFSKTVIAQKSKETDDSKAFWIRAENNNELELTWEQHWFFVITIGLYFDFDFLCLLTRRIVPSRDMHGVTFKPGQTVASRSMSEVDLRPFQRSSSPIQRSDASWEISSRVPSPVPPFAEARTNFSFPEELLITSRVSRESVAEFLQACQNTELCVCARTAINILLLCDGWSLDAVSDHVLDCIPQNSTEMLVCNLIFDLQQDHDTGGTARACEFRTLFRPFASFYRMSVWVKLLNWWI
jgi:hypothetical protein